MDQHERHEFESRYDVDLDDLPETVDEATLERMETVAELFDYLVRVPGTDFRLGIDPLVGAIPVVGDVISAGVSLYIVLESARLGVSYSTLIRMLANVAVDVGGGSIPYLGGVFDAVFKANKRNLELALEDLTGEANLLDVEDEGPDEPESISIEID